MIFKCNMQMYKTIGRIGNSKHHVQIKMSSPACWGTGNKRTQLPWCPSLGRSSPIYTHTLWLKKVDSFLLHPSTKQMWREHIMQYSCMYVWTPQKYMQTCVALYFFWDILASVSQVPWISCSRSCILSRTITTRVVNSACRAVKIGI